MACRRERTAESQASSGLDASVGISILKPLKGCDHFLSSCLESFFTLKDDRYELLFSVADESDPAAAVVKNLMQKYPRVPAKLLFGALDYGPNPKVNNLARSYSLARYDLLLISDSNICADADYLTGLRADFTSGVGVLTSVVAGVEAHSFAGRMEASLLNSYYSRWMLIAERFGLPVVLGKSMLFKRSEANRFGGLANLGRYLAEDYMAGKAMALLGLKTKIALKPIRQPIGAMSFANFWARHLRWGRIRRSQAPVAQAGELVMSALPSGLLGAFATSLMTPLGFFQVLLGHLILWFAFEQVQFRSFTGAFPFRNVLGLIQTFAEWCLREILGVALWLHVTMGKTVVWRGQHLRLGRDGLLQLPSNDCRKVG